MQVFKYYFKIAKSFFPMMIMYITIFMFFAVFATSQSNDNSGFVVSKPKVAIVNRDDSIFSTGLVKYLKDNTDVVEINDTDVALKEAIYFQTVSFVYDIPDGFGDDLFNNKVPKISTLQVQSSDAAQAYMLGENYVRLAGPRIAAGMSQTEVVSGIKEDILKVNTVTEIRGAKISTSLSKVQFFYNFASYVMLALCTMIISMVMIIFTSRNIKRRNFISPLSYGKIISQLFMGNFVFAVGIWALFIIVSCILYPNAMITMNGLLYGLNSFVFVILALSIGFMIGSLVKSKNAVSGITNVIALGSSFLCGVFMPQEFLGETVINIAKFLPTYWYVKSNELIYGLSNFSFVSLRPVLINIAIVLGFAVAVFAITFITGRMQRKEQ